MAVLPRNQSNRVASVLHFIGGGRGGRVSEGEEEKRRRVGGERMRRKEGGRGREREGGETREGARERQSQPERQRQR
jgi:hypothetical protein